MFPVLPASKSVNLHYGMVEAGPSAVSILGSYESDGTPSHGICKKRRVLLDGLPV